VSGIMTISRFREHLRNRYGEEASLCGLVEELLPIIRVPPVGSAGRTAEGKNVGINVIVGKSHELTPTDIVGNCLRMFRELACLLDTDNHRWMRYRCGKVPVNPIGFATSTIEHLTRMLSRRDSHGGIHPRRSVGHVEGGMRSASVCRAATATQ